MLNKNEMQVMKELFSKIGENFTMREISISLSQKYPQTFKVIKYLENKGMISLKNIGKSKVVNLNFSEGMVEYASVEIDRTLSLLQKNKRLSIIASKLSGIKQFVCILFGSYASGKFKEHSDIDLAFIIPEEYDKSSFEKKIKNKLSLYNIDINVFNENSLLEMWQNKSELNVGNEILKNHFVMSGFDYFISLLRRHYGR